MDNRSFFGGLLHVFYAPEYESEEDTQLKLIERKRDVEGAPRPTLERMFDASTAFLGTVYLSRRSVPFRLYGRQSRHACSSLFYRNANWDASVAL